MSWRAGGGRTGDALVDARGFQKPLRDLWRTHTLAEIAAASGVSVTVLHHLIRGTQPTVRVRTAVKLTTYLQEVTPTDRPA